MMYILFCLYFKNKQTLENSEHACQKEISDNMMKKCLGIKKDEMLKMLKKILIQ